MPTVGRAEKIGAGGKKERGELCSTRSGAACGRFTRGLRRWSGFLRPAPTAELRHRHSHHAEYPPRDRATLRDAPSSPLGAPVAGGEGAAAPGAAGSEGTARPRPPEGCPSSGAASLPRTQPLRLPGASYCCCHPHLGRDGEGTTPQTWPEVPHLWLLLETRSGRGLGRPGRAAVPVPFPGGPEGAVSPRELGWGKAAEMVRKDRPEPRERRRGGRGGCPLPQGHERVPVPRHGSLGVGPSAVRLEGSPGRAEVTGDTAWAQLAAAPGRPEMFFLAIS